MVGPQSRIFSIRSWVACADGALSGVTMISAVEAPVFGFAPVPLPVQISVAGLATSDKVLM